MFAVIGCFTYIDHIWPIILAASQLPKCHFLYKPSFNSWETNMIWTLSSVVIRDPKGTISMILSKTDYAIISIKTHYTYLTAPMDIIFGAYTQNSGWETLPLLLWFQMKWNNSKGRLEFRALAVLISNEMKWQQGKTEYWWLPSHWQPLAEET